MIIDVMGHAINGLKNIFMLFFIACLIVCNTTIVAAASISITASTDRESVRSGESIELTLSISEMNELSDGVNAYHATLEYDRTLFETVTKEDFTMLNYWEMLQYNTETGSLVAVKRTRVKNSEDIAKVKLITKIDLKPKRTDLIIKDFITSEGKGDIPSSNESKQTIVIESETGELPENPDEPPEQITLSLSIKTQDEYVDADGNISANIDIDSYVEINSTVYASTNGKSGFSILVSSIDDDIDLRSKNDAIPASNMQPVAGTSAWAIKGGLISDFAKISKRSEGGALILRTDSANADDESSQCTMTVAISTSRKQTNGLYRNAMVYTVVANMDMVKDYE